MESFVPGRRTTPWLGRGGLTVVGGLYAIGCVLVFWGNYAEEQFLASGPQLIGITLVILALIVAALRLRPNSIVAQGKAPSPWLAGAMTFVLTSGYWAPAVFVTAEWYEWVTVAVWTAAAAGGILLIRRWSGREGWSQMHIFALAAGATLTYVWVSFPLRPELGGPLMTDLVTNTVCAAIAFIVLALAARKARMTYGAGTSSAGGGG